MSATEQGKQSLAQFIEASLQYSLGGFIDAHDDTEGALSHAKKVVDSYAPSNTSITPHRILINQLMNFETDLRIHAFIEEKVLIPRAIALEKKLLTLKNQA